MPGDSIKGEMKTFSRYSYMVDLDIAGNDASVGRVRVHNIEGRIDQADLTGFDDGSAWAIGRIILKGALLESGRGQPAFRPRTGGRTKHKVKTYLRYSYMVDVDIDDESGAMRVHIHNIEDGCGISNSEMTGFDDGSALAIGRVIVEDARVEYEVTATRAKRRREREAE
jgi:hypothetical protein